MILARPAVSVVKIARASIEDTRKLGGNVRLTTYLLSKLAARGKRNQNASRDLHTYCRRHNLFGQLQPYHVQVCMRTTDMKIKELEYPMFLPHDVADANPQNIIYRTTWLICSE